MTPKGPETTNANSTTPGSRGRRWGWVDVVLALACLAGAAAFLPAMRHLGPPVAAVYVDSRLVGRYPLDQDRTVEIAGHEGALHAAVVGGTIRVLDAPCRRKVCVESGAIRSPGQQIVCAPGHVLLQIESAEKQDTLDAVVR